MANNKLTGKQRGFLRSMSNKLEPIVLVGKDGITPEVTDSLDKALEARELVKIKALNNSPIDIKEATGVLMERTQSEVVQVIGNKAVFYRESKNKKKIELPES